MTDRCIDKDMNRLNGYWNMAFKTLLILCGRVGRKILMNKFRFQCFQGKNPSAVIK